MTEVKNLVLEPLKRFQAQMARVEEKVDGLGADVRSTKQHMAAFLSSEFRQDGDIAAIKTRLERIERRLDLND